MLLLFIGSWFNLIYDRLDPWEYSVGERPYNHALSTGIICDTSEPGRVQKNDVK